MACTRDLMRRLAGKSPARSSLAQILRGKIWLSYILHSQNLTPGEFSKKFLEGREGGNDSLIYKWISGTTSPSKRTAMRISRHIPGAAALYFLPLWELLEDKPIPKSKIIKLTDPYWNKGKSKIYSYWKFPENELSRPGMNRIIHLRDNEDELFQRGDIYGFMALAAVTREAEAFSDGDRHWFLSAHLYQAVPYIAKKPWIRAHLSLLIKCFKNIQSRLQTSKMLFRVDWRIIRKQIRDENYEPYYLWRPFDSKGRRRIEPENPIIIISW